MVLYRKQMHPFVGGR